MPATSSMLICRIERAASSTKPMAISAPTKAAMTMVQELIALT